MKRLSVYIKKLLVNIIITLIVIYQNTLSPVLPSTCKFSPSCSNYMILSIQKYGLLNGIYKGLKRILRCNPFSKYKHWDPVK